MKTWKVEQEDFGTLCICAVRYAMGRETYMPGLVREIITPHLQELSNKTIGVMVEDCARQRRYDNYGHREIDMPGWLEWEQRLLAEKKRREHEVPSGNS